MIAEPPPDVWQYLTIIFLLICSMFFSSGETAFISCNILKLKYLSKKSHRARRVLEIIKDKNKFLITSLIGNSIVNIMIGALITSITLKYSNKNVTSIAAGVATILVLIFGEILPKSVALVFPHSIALTYSALTKFLMLFLKPISTIFLYFTSFVLYICGIKIEAKNYLVSEEDLKSFFEDSTSSGLLTNDEKFIMDRILKYDDVFVKDVMIPRTKIVALDIKTTISDALKSSKSTSISRFPVYIDNIYNIIGILYIKDFIFSEEYAQYTKIQSKKEEAIPHLKIDGFLRSPCFIFANTHPSHARQILKKAEQNLAIIIDEYGGTLGLITIENLNEKIFGNIIDEYDAKENANDSFYQKREDGILLKGDALLSLVNEEFNLKLHSKNHRSIAGLIMEAAGNVPQENFFIEEDGNIFIVNKMNGTKIEYVLMKEKDK